MDRPPPAYTPKASNVAATPSSVAFGGFDAHFRLLLASIGLLLLDAVPKMFMLPFAIALHPNGARVAISVIIVIVYDAMLLYFVDSEHAQRNWIKKFFSVTFLLNQVFTSFVLLCLSVEIARGAFLKFGQRLDVTTNIAISLWMMAATSLAVFIVMVRYRLLKEMMKGRQQEVVPAPPAPTV